MTFDQGADIGESPNAGHAQFPIQLLVSRCYRCPNLLFWGMGI